MNADLATRRATVARLHAAGTPLRGIADAVGVSKDTVARDLDALAALTAKAAAHRDRQRLRRRARPAHRCRPHTLRRRRSDTAAPAAPARDASRDAKARPASGPASGETRLTLAATPRLLSDLAVLTANGVDIEAAVAGAVWTLARAYRTAWETGLYPTTADPALTGHEYAPYRPLTGRLRPAS
ncbi:hypothetical protein ACFVU3_08005 [Streptomyces sp. NPDC058052]|uniref:hypothetical protein n=1 Tax=Streptomyces sp. NPDC058052 TaxID=3346316 RepID=UPI0036EB8F55